jgi:hypothetical protein
MNTYSLINVVENVKRLALFIARAVLFLLVAIYVITASISKKWKVIGMKRFIILILEPVLFIYVVLQTLAGFAFGGLARGAASNPFSSQASFNLGDALLTSFVSLIIALIFTGAIFVLLRVKELLEEQIQLLKKIDLSNQRETNIGQIGSMQASAERQD